MTIAAHDTLGLRLARILGRLSAGEALDASELAAEFGVTVRTVQRDLNERFGWLDLDRRDGRYRLNPAILGRIGSTELIQFAGLAGVRGLFPSLTNDFLRDIFDSRVQAAILVKGHAYQDMSGKEVVFRQLEGAILDRRIVSFDLAKARTSKSYVDVQPYKLLNHNGIWYLAGKHAGKLKTFAFSGIERLLVCEQTYIPEVAVDRAIKEDDGIWLSEKLLQVVLTVSPEAAGYFKRRKLIANQVIDEELADGSLIVSTKVGHANQVLPIVRYWIPHVRILSPEHLRGELTQGLEQYLVGGPGRGEALPRRERPSTSASASSADCRPEA